MRFAIFSGRFDPFHIGHLYSIISIAQRFHHVIVPILDYPGRTSNVQAMQTIAETLFKRMSPLNNVTFVINTVHFGKIAKEEYQMFIEEYIGRNANVTYLSGNKQVIEHMKEIGIKRYEFFSRFRDDIYSGTRIRGQMKNGRAF